MHEAIWRYLKVKFVYYELSYFSEMMHFDGENKLMRETRA
jgi:hypothetical protein